MKYTAYLAFSGSVLGEIRRISHEIHPNEPRTNGPIFTILLINLFIYCWLPVSYVVFLRCFEVNFGL